ncbi:MAG: hypothetical protein HC808_17205 [Candidatus Competibacteraceae bacterium]|nr:hypothetical protein [Candidatus Competibacteraceae bacterium]
MCVVFAFALLLPATGVTGGSRLEPVDPSLTDEHALWLGRRVLAIAAAVRNPDAPDAMAAILELGLDSRYYVMVRGWLVAQLRGDMSISQARNGDVSPQIAARIAFLEKAIRAIDLE